MSSETGGPFAALEEVAARQSAEEQAGRALAGARARLILGRDAKSVFFATLVLRLTAEPGWDLDTLATDGRKLRYHPPFVNALCPDELVGVLAHEVMHNALAHPLRQDGREFGLWNIACDLAINPLLLQAGILFQASRLMPGEGNYARFEPGKSAEEYYAGLIGTPDRGSGDEGDPEPESADRGRCGGVEAPAQSAAAEAGQTKAEWRVAVAQAEQAAAGRGTLPDGLRRSVADVLHPPTDWKAVLREFVAATARNDYSWARPNRRFLGQGLYLPGLRSEELGQVVIAVDTSGSIGGALLGTFAAEVNAVLSTYECSVTVLYHDTEVQKVQTWTSGDGPLTLEPVGGGGTSHSCVFDWLIGSGTDPACVVCLTDLETVFPTDVPAIPVLWAVPGPAPTTPPFGRVVPLSP